ncbi:outer membrane channel protein TolC [Alteromonas aestuariivivens]|uniref:Outer membrane channel protein TolC n=1 Tax=Alteromonas aestuariivivens TaxID=1938339 RepID=A0A3D8MCS2_9ALTE|nr:outer membrane channel protein TolC [Alteromonas aestuariivivens]RDV27973.1 outer membrane channel protein TolC [Alteromonas aestuariivivens]
MKRTLLSLIIGMGVTTSALADDLLQVYQQALANDPLVNSAKAQRDAAFEGISISRANLFPQLSGFVGYTTSNSDIASDELVDNEFVRFSGENDTDVLAYGLDLQMSLYDHANWVGLNRAEKVAERSDAIYASVMQGVIVRVVNAYFDVLSARDSLEFVRAEKRAFERQLEQTKQRFEVGLTAITDVHEAQANYDNTLAQEIQAENQLEQALEVLRVITGKYHDRLFALDTDSFSARVPAPASVDDWLKIAEDSNLDLLANRLAVDIAKEDISSAQAGHYPTLGLSASYGRTDRDSTSTVLNPLNNIESTFTNNPPTLDSYSIGVRLNVPIFEGLRVTSQSDRARYLYVAASQDLEQTYRETVQGIRSSFNDVKAAISVIRALEQAVVSAESALKATEAGFDVGTRTIVDVLDSTRNLFDARRNLSNARYAFIRSIVNLKQAAGNLTSEDVELINRGLTPVKESDEG